MRLDLIDAQAAVNWADSQIPILQERFLTWQRLGPYELVMEPDPDSADWEFLVAILRSPLDPLIPAEIGAIINSTRTALDFLMSALLVRNGVKPNSKAHFPIRKDAADFLNTVDMMEQKKWVSSIEAAAIKNSKAHSGGDRFLYPLHKLDIMRKHERILVLEPLLTGAQLTVLDSTPYIHRRVMKDKTVLYRLPRGSFHPTKGNTFPTAEIFFNEPSLIPRSKPAIGILRAFIKRAREVIAEFSTF